MANVGRAGRLDPCPDLHSRGTLGNQKQCIARPVIPGLPKVGVESHRTRGLCEEDHGLADRFKHDLVAA